MSKTLLIVSGGIEAVDAARRAKEMGHTVVVSDRDPEAPGFAFADSCLIADVYGANETASAAERYSRKIRKIDGRDLRRRRRTPHRRHGGAAAAHSRPAASCRGTGLRQAGDEKVLPQRRGECALVRRSLHPAGTAAHRHRARPRPGHQAVDSRGSRGVQRVAQVEDLAKAFWLARSHSPSERVMVEQYLDGPQVSTESIVLDGVCYTPGFSDRNYEYLEKYAPFFIENGGDLPSHLPQTIQQKVKELVGRAASAMGVTSGTVKGDIVVHKGEPYVIELAARLSGGFFCTREIPLNTGVDFIGAAINIALGEPVAAADLEPRHQHAVVQRYAFPAPGTVTAVDGAEAARAVPGIAEVVITAKAGDVIPPAGDKRPSAAMVLATGPSHDAALKAANDALALIRIQIA